jgi:hypothetical protein
VFAFGEHAGHPFLAMEYLPGGTLADRVKASGPLPPREAAEIVLKQATAVAHAHAMGVVHRDIKPGNVLLAANGEPRLTDFGLAKVGRSDMTATGAVLGTPAYMSPEQAAGRTKEVGASSDVYSLGAVLFDLLTGKPPFAGDSVAVTLQKVLSESAPSPRKHVRSIPRDLETICLKCLEKNPADRYPSADALADDLRQYYYGGPISAGDPLAGVKRFMHLPANLGVELYALLVVSWVLIRNFCANIVDWADIGVSNKTGLYIKSIHHGGAFGFCLGVIVGFVTGIVRGSHTSRGSSIVTQVIIWSIWLAIAGLVIAVVMPNPRDWFARREMQFHADPQDI